MGVFEQYHDRKQYRNINQVDDIDGAHAGSLKKSPNTKRSVNPLNPTYQYIGDSELTNKINPYS